MSSTSAAGVPPSTLPPNYIQETFQHMEDIAPWLNVKSNTGYSLRSVTLLPDGRFLVIAGQIGR